MDPRICRRIALLPALGLMLCTATSSAALPIPSKTADPQSLAQREADLAVIHNVLEREEVVRALAAHGFGHDAIENRLARLSPHEVHAFAGNLEQLQAAGVDVPQYIWILLAVFLGVLILAAIF
jgi:hypothetical protein